MCHKSFCLIRSNFKPVVNTLNAQSSSSVIMNHVEHRILYINRQPTRTPDRIDKVRVSLRASNDGIRYDFVCVGTHQDLLARDMMGEMDIRN